MTNTNDAYKACLEATRFSLEEALKVVTEAISDLETHNRNTSVGGLLRADKPIETAQATYKAALAINAMR